jgi:hypothetical protein
VGDRLLHYDHPPLGPVRREGFSAYGLAAALGAVMALGVLAGFGSRAIPESLWPLGAPCIVFSIGVALLGCALAALEHRRRQTLLWVGVGMTLIALVAGGLAVGVFRL